MRTAIKSTNIDLDMTIIPGVVLIPSRMIILERPVPAYNKVLRTATKKMQFGKNEGINFEEVKEEEKFEHTLTATQQDDSEAETSSSEIEDTDDEVEVTKSVENVKTKKSLLYQERRKALTKNLLPYLS